MLVHASLGLNALWYGLVSTPTDYEYWMGTSLFVAKDCAVAAVVGLATFVLAESVFAVFQLCTRKVWRAFYIRTFSFIAVVVCFRSKPTVMCERCPS